MSVLLESAGLTSLDSEQAKEFEVYLSRILQWNARINLTSVRDEDGILSRHFIECIACARALPAVGTLLDFGSGAGLPGIPIALCRADISVTLAESQGKKAAFLREAVRVLGLSTHVHTGRAEDLTQEFGCVILRAVDKMASAVRTACGLVQPDGWLALMTTRVDLDSLKQAAGDRYQWGEVTPLPSSASRILALGRRAQ